MSNAKLMGVPVAAWTPIVGFLTPLPNLTGFLNLFYGLLVSLFGFWLLERRRMSPRMAFRRLFAILRGPVTYPVKLERLPQWRDGRMHPTQFRRTPPLPHRASHKPAAKRAASMAITIGLAIAGGLYACPVAASFQLVTPAPPIDGVSPVAEKPATGPASLLPVAVLGPGEPPPVHILVHQKPAGASLRRIIPSGNTLVFEPPALSEIPVSFVADGKRGWRQIANQAITAVGLFLSADGYRLVVTATRPKPPALGPSGALHAPDILLADWEIRGASGNRAWVVQRGADHAPPVMLVEGTADGLLGQILKITRDGTKVVVETALGRIEGSQ
jgi:hypothetical protein